MALLLGIIGIFLPLLPTTPFLILTAVLFNIGSPSFHNWLLNHKYFGPPVLDWQKRHVIKFKFKVLASLMMLGSVILVYAKDSVPEAGKVIYFIFVLGLLSYIWSRKGR